MSTNIARGRTLLWVDDDGPERFLYEAYMLERSGWKVQWARSVMEGMESLGQERFDAVLLDQMLPFGVLGADGGDPPDVWAGCLLLYWLRGLSRPSAAPPVRASDEREFSSRRAREENREVPAIIVSAFYDDDVDAAVKKVQAVPQFSKPLEVQQLLAVLEAKHD